MKLRPFAIVAACLLLSVGLFVSLAQSRGALRGRGGTYVAYVPPVISSVAFSAPFRYLDNYPNTPQYWAVGDTFFTEWGDDNKFYITCNDCDTQQLNNTATQNMILSTMTNFNLATAANGGPSMVWVNPNTLASPWGSWNSGQPAADGNKSFKNTGLLCYKPSGAANGHLYLNTRRYNQASGTYTFDNSQIIISTNYGVAWSPVPPGTNAPYASPMFGGLGTGYTLGGYFHYGQCYNTAGPDSSNAYIYAGVYHTFGATYDGTVPSPTYLARVPVGKIDGLSGADWQYYTGPVGAADGDTNSSYWASTFSTTTAPIATVIVNPNAAPGGSFVTPQIECCGNDFVYLPRYQQYLHFGTGGNTVTAWAGPHPWGSFRVIGQFTSQHLENWPQPIIASLQNGGQSLVMAMSGDTSTCCDPSSPSNWETLILRTVTISP